MPSERFSNETGDDPLSEGLRLYHGARDTNDWPPFVAWLGDHPELASEIAQHIKTDKIGREWIPPRMTPVQAGTMIDEFEIREEIGRGGMGVVYRAFDTNLKREVALKMIRPGVPLSAVELAKFREEAETVATFDHENIVPILAFRGTDDSPYIVMPLLKQSLAQRLKQLGEARRLPEKEATRLVRDIALGVHHAQQHGLIHRDLKPGNILLDEKVNPHVADFGLARRVDVAATISGAIVGTVAYMAPEQARGDKYLTTGADIHALGVILFELLTGALPFGGADVPSILRRVTDEPAPPVSVFRPDVHRDLAAICAKCLEKSPTDRYQSAQELADDLNCFLEGREVKARPRGVFGDFRNAVSRRTEEQPFVVWAPAFFAAVHHTAVHCTIAGLAFAGASAVWLWVAMSYHLLSWLAQLWWFGVRRRKEMSKVELQSLAIHLAMWPIIVSLVPLHFVYFGPNVLTLYPPLNIITTMGLFSTSALISGRVYPAAFVFLSLNVLFAFVPMWSWPIIHGLSGGVLFGFAGLLIWEADRAARKGRETGALLT